MAFIVLFADAAKSTKDAKEWEKYLESAVLKLESALSLAVVEWSIFLHANVSEDKMLELMFYSKTKLEIKELSQIIRTKFQDKVNISILRHSY